MLHTPRRAIAAAITLLAVGQMWLATTDPPRIGIEDAQTYEGQDVTIEGVVHATQSNRDGIRLTLSQAGHAVEVLAPNGEWPRGSYLTITGRLARLGLDLVLMAEHINPAQTPAAPHVSLQNILNQSPDTLIRVSGQIAKNQLVGDGAHIHLGDGPWPKEGHVSATAIALPDAACACIKLHANSVSPWKDYRSSP